MTRHQKFLLAIPVVAALAFAGYEIAMSDDNDDEQAGTQLDKRIDNHAQRTLAEGRKIFRFDTFGDEAFWGDTIKLHQAIQGKRFGGVGPGVSPRTALAVGLKVDVDALPDALIENLKKGRVNLDDPATTLVLLKLNAVIGVTGFFESSGRLHSIGIQCALCHSAVDDSLAPGIGHRLDGWANRDLNVGAIINLAPDLSTVAALLEVDQSTVRKVLGAWGPGKFDAELLLDGKGFRPDGKTAATLIPPAYGLAGVNLATYTGWGSVPYWNAFVGNLEMHGSGAFFDPRLNNKDQFPVAARAAFGNVRQADDGITSRLAALQFYQLAIPHPRRHAAASTSVLPITGKDCSTGRPNARLVTCRRSSRSRGGRCTRRRKSELTISRPAAPPSIATGRRR